MKLIITLGIILTIIVIFAISDRIRQLIIDLFMGEDINREKHKKQIRKEKEDFKNQIKKQIDG